MPRTSPLELAVAMPPSTRRQTAEAVVAAFNRMDIDAIMSYRSPECMRYLLPSTDGETPTNNEDYRAHLKILKPIFANFSLEAHDIIEDDSANRICMYLRARADTVVGEYVNEYMWILDFDESGANIVQSKEFTDTVMKRDFYPKLVAAMRAHQQQATL